MDNEKSTPEVLENLMNDLLEQENSEKTEDTSETVTDSEAVTEDEDAADGETVAEDLNEESSPENDEEIVIEEKKRNPLMILIDEIKVNFFENSITRLLVSWIVIACYHFFDSKYEFIETDFFKSINLVTYVIFIAAMFLVLTVINNRLLDRILLFCSMLIYGTFTAIQGNEFYFTIGISIFMGIVVLYCIGDTAKLKLGKLPAIAVIALFGLAFTLYVGFLTSYKYLTFKTPTYDFGIFSQMFHYMKETFQPFTTCERDDLLSHFAVHFSPIYYLLLPFYYIFPTPVTLLIGQAAIIASGLIPLYLICKKHSLSNLSTVLFSLCYVLMPSMANGCFYYLHENKFLTALILWLVYALEKNSWVFTIITALLVMLVKEDAPVYVAVIGLYFMMSRRNVKKGIVTFAFAVAYFFTVSYFLNKYGEGTMDFRYNNFIYDGSGSLITVIKAVILNPIYTIKESFTQDKFVFILQTFVPLAFMPLMTRKPSRILLFIPYILINLMSSWPYQYDINFQYTYGTSALLFYIMILNFKDMNPKTRDKILSIAATTSIFMFCCFTYNRSKGFEEYENDMKNGYVQDIQAALDEIPEDASVVATTFFTANLYEHREVYDWRYTKYKDDAEYLAIDLRPGYGVTIGTNIMEHEFDFNGYINNPDYEVVSYTEDVIIVLKKVSPLQ